MSHEELVAENERLKKEKERLTALLAQYSDGTKEEYTIKDEKKTYRYSYYYEEEQRSTCAL